MIFFFFFLPGRRRLDEKTVRTSDGQRTNLHGHRHRQVAVGDTFRRVQPPDRRVRRGVRVERDKRAGRPSRRRYGRRDDGPGRRRRDHARPDGGRRDYQLGRRRVGRGEGRHRSVAAEQKGARRQVADARMSR